jgi:hypothetical protein
MQSLAPFGIEAAIEAVESLQGSSDERIQQKAMALEHARYEVTRTRREHPLRAARVTGAKGKLSFAPTEPWW